jgi:biotin transporter BioY
MAKAGTGSKLLVWTGGVALLIVAAHFPVNLHLGTFWPGATTLEVVAAILIGMFTDWERALYITILYCLAVIAGVPHLIWGHGAAPNFAFLDGRENGFTLGLIPAAVIGALIAPDARGKIQKSLLAAVLGVAAFMLVGLLWLARFIPVPEIAAFALTAGFLLPGLLKALIAWGLALAIRRFV